MRSKTKTSKFTIQDRIIEKYLLIVKEFMDMLSESKCIHDLPNPTSNMFIGLNSIYRVFEYILIQTKNLEKVSYYSKKTCYYYLEYTEQIYLSNLSQNLNQMDAVLFVYKKTIFNLYNGDGEDSYGTIANIMTLSEDMVNIGDSILKPMLKNISKCMNVLLYWSNTSYSLTDRKEICLQYLEKFIYLTQDNNQVLIFLEAVQTYDMAYTQYIYLLKSILEFYEKKRKPAALFTDWQFDRFFVNRDIFYEKIQAGNMKELVEYVMN